MHTAIFQPNEIRNGRISPVTYLYIPDIWQTVLDSQTIYKKRGLREEYDLKNSNSIKLKKDRLSAIVCFNMHDIWKTVLGRWLNPNSKAKCKVSGRFQRGNIVALGWGRCLQFRKKR